ncbi:cathepsin B-like [Uranotaenia lowii]|uniref:cathepsin B-like n=1 Tax=Uranotaenia lowii TaxID=190385 RepID=UPI00247AB977|nr:cathepsin B-like [Uranotaenia lowii]
MRAFLILALCQAVFGQQYYRLGSGSRYTYSGQIASEIRNLTQTWTPGNNPMPLTHYRVGSLPPQPQHRLPEGMLLLKTVEDIELPENFDARQQWPECQSIRTVRNQGCCGSCFAISATSAMTDRWCIHSQDHETFEFGSIDVLSCCTECGDGCEGGYLPQTWSYWVRRGISSGGAYGSNQGCRPYPFTSCKTADEENSAPQCMRSCNSAYNVTKAVDDRRFGRSAYAVAREERKIMEEIYVGGPVQASFSVFLDFKAYKSGVYRHVWGPHEGYHAIKIVGWGVENIKGVPVKYWLVSNSWGQDWGENGFFRIVRGEDHMGIESNVYAGMPDYKKHMKLQGLDW